MLNVGTTEILRAKLPHSQVIVMPHVGYAPMIERPQLAAEDYVKFRDGLAR